MRRVHPQIRQGRLGPQRSRPVPVLLRHWHTRAGRRPVRPAAHVQRVPGRVRRARSHAGHIMRHVNYVPENGRGWRRCQNAVQAQKHQVPVSVTRSRAG